MASVSGHHSSTQLSSYSIFYPSSSSDGITYSTAHTNFRSKPVSSADISWPFTANSSFCLCSLPSLHATSNHIYLSAGCTPPPNASLLKVKVNVKALPFGAIQESLDDISDIIAVYPSLKGAKLPILMQKLAKEAVFG